MYITLLIRSTLLLLLSVDEEGHCPQNPITGTGECVPGTDNIKRLHRSATKSPQSITTLLIISIPYLHRTLPKVHFKTLSVQIKVLLLYMRKYSTVKMFGINVASRYYFSSIENPRLRFR